METLRRKLGFTNCFAVDPIGRSGGIAMLWKEEVQLEFFNYYLRHISGWNVDPEFFERWLITSFYG